ncbi:MAG: cyclase family protein [bacterium]|nr:cyclase family protein [bacterium]
MIYDVTLPISPGMIIWPGDPAVEYQRLDGREVISRWCMGSHTGTHVDAPCHYIEGAATVDRLDSERLIGPCRLLDLSGVPLVTADILRRFSLKGIKRLILRTANSEMWRRQAKTFDYDFVGLSGCAAEYLIESGLELIGVDGLSVEPYDSSDQVHLLLLEAGIVIIEGLALADVPEGEYLLICAPLLLKDGDGAPARVFLSRPEA